MKTVRTVLLLLVILALTAGCLPAKIPLPVTGGQPQELQPTETATEEPTQEPTQEPTLEPTAEATSAPTQEVTPEMTVEPTATVEATAEPLDEVLPNEPDDSSSGTTIFLPAIFGARTVVLPPNPTTGTAWPMAAGNPQRTSWSPEEVTGNLTVEWYRPIEAYISQNVQLIASDGLIFVSTARGLYALNAVTGDLAWRFDTIMPLGNSPTVSNGTVYVGGYDRKLYALNASNGQLLWAYDGAGAGYSANPLVVDGKVIVGNRDGRMYAIGAQGTSQAGRLVWSFLTGGAIDLSAAYNNGVVYFAANDNYAYAVRASDGTQVWKSAKLPGDGYQSYWPVIFHDKVIFAAASGYRTSGYPGIRTLKDPSGNDYTRIYDLERDELFAGVADGGTIGTSSSAETWANGKPVISASRLLNYFESKPWRKVLVALNQSNGSEYTFDSDRDGRMESIPVAMWGTQSGNRYPPVVGSDGTLYVSNVWQNLYIPQGKVMGWRLGSGTLSLVGGQGAVDEPQALSMGGSTIYRTICCDRAGTAFSTTSNTSRELWTYSSILAQQAPNYDQMWYGVPDNDPVRLQGNYGNQNGVYHNHGDQNPLIPYGGRLYVHRSNAIIAYGPAGGRRAQPLLQDSATGAAAKTLSESALKARLEWELQKIVNVGHLRPGYYNNGSFNYSQFTDYFSNPGDTLYTLSIALPHLSPALQSQVRTYLQNEYRAYFASTMYTQIGWADGAARESMPLPPEVVAGLSSLGPRQGADPRFSWSYPQFNIYAMWKYATIFPSEALAVYNQAKTKIEAPVSSLATNAYLQERPYEINAYVAGYYGFLRLQEMAGRTSQDAALRTTVTNEMNRLMALRASSFSKDTPYVNGYQSYHLRVFNVARNFIYMTPELGDYLYQNARTKVNDAMTEYNNVAPYWFVARYNAAINESGRQHLYDSSLFKAKAHALNQSQAELSQYLDVPAFETGDLFYIQNLVDAIEAP